MANDIGPGVYVEKYRSSTGHPTAPGLVHIAVGSVFLVEKVFPGPFANGCEMGLRLLGVPTISPNGRCGCVFRLFQGPEGPLRLTSEPTPTKREGVMA